MEPLSTLLQDFHFIRPWWLLGLVPLAVLIWRLGRGNPGQGIDDMVDPHLRAAVIDDPRHKPGNVRRRLPAIAIALTLLALSGPTWERIPQPLYQLQQGRIIVLNLDGSMDRSDMQPSRLQRARYKIDDLLGSMPGILTGLVAFAGDAFVVAPLSDDMDTISNLLHALSTDTLPVQGNRADRGLGKARDLLARVAIDQGEVILVTDTASPLAVSAARKLSSAGVRVSVLEVAPASDRSQRALLESIAQSGQGVAVRLVADNTDIQRLNAPFERWVARSQSETSETQRVADQWRDLGPWLLLPVALIVSLMFRRGWMLQSALLAAGIQGGILLFPQPAAALDWSSWWKNNDQRQWQAVQAYREGDMQTALQSFAEDPGARGAYNRGNVMAKTGQLQEALAAYDEALRLQPDFEDAEYNRKLVEEALREQQQQQQAQQEGGQGEDDTENPEQSPGQPQNEGEESENRSQAGEKNPSGEPQQEASDSGDQPEEAGDNLEEPSEPGQGEDSDTQTEPLDPQSAGAPSPAEETPPEPGQTEPENQALAEQHAPLDEDAQALELMLRQVPDDPGALLKRKFKYQYQSRQP